MKSPEEKLCSRWWRLGHSAYILWGILSFGFLTAVAFWILGIRTRRRSLIVSAIAWTVVNVGTIYLTSIIDSGTKANPSNTVESGALGWLIIAGWVGGILHLSLVRKQWLLWSAYQVSGPWYVQGNSYSNVPQNRARTVTGAQADSLLRGNPVQDGASGPDARGISSGQSTYAMTQKSTVPGPVPNFMNRIELNSAEPKDFLDLGLNQPWADWLVMTRERLGGFVSTDQLLTEAQMPPHVFLGIRDRVLVEPPNGGRINTKASSGRRLDL